MPFNMQKTICLYLVPFKIISTDRNDCNCLLYINLEVYCIYLKKYVWDMFIVVAPDKADICDRKKKIGVEKAWNTTHYFKYSRKRK
jgi:hypothetical protein